MLSNAPNLTWLRSFEAAARLLNFTLAAGELGLTQTAVSLHIKLLEAHLGAQLFVRNARHLSLSTLGEAYFDAVGDALANIDRATNRLFAPSERAVVTVRVPISTAALWLAPRLAAFTQSHPHIHLRVVSTIWETAARDENVDIDIRYGVGHWPEYEAEQISTESLVLIHGAGRAAPSLTEISGAEIPVVHVLGLEDLWDRYLSAQGVAQIAVAPVMTVDTTAVAISLVAAGAGFAVIQSRFAQSAISDGAAIAVSGAPVPIAQSHYLVQGKTKRPQRAEVKQVRDWVRTAFAYPTG